MLWQHYVFRRGAEVQDMWERMYSDRSSKGSPTKLLYIAGKGFDIRAQIMLDKYLESLRSSGVKPEQADLVLVNFSGYELSEALQQQTNENAAKLQEMFEAIGNVHNVPIGSSVEGEDDISVTSALRHGTDSILKMVQEQTDIILDVSSLPRVVYLSLMTGLLHKLIPDGDLKANGINFQVVVAEDALLDSQIKAEDPSNDLVHIPGFLVGMHAESMQDWPLVWFPILGENRIGQLEKVMNQLIHANAEVCPVLPHPSNNPRRADNILIEYRDSLFDKLKTSVSNILYVHELHPFEAYRRLLEAMDRYCNSLEILGGCRLVVTPLASKLITIGAGLACFEKRPKGTDEKYSIAIPYAEPTRYVADTQVLLSSKPEIAMLMLTGDAYTD